MILVDANLLVYARVKGMPQHQTAREWLDDELNRTSRVGLPWPSLLAFVRLVSNPRVFERPETIESAWSQVASWLDSGSAWIPLPTDRHREVLAATLRDCGGRANHLPDAHLAALAIEHGLTLCSPASRVFCWGTVAIKIVSREEPTMSLNLKKLDAYSDHAFALLRIVAGLMFAFHGMQKIFGILSESQPPVGSQIWFGGLIELACGLAIAVGFQTRWAAFLASGTMAVAYVQFHWKFQLGAAMLPTINQGELAALYSFVFLLIATSGGGRWAVDRDEGL